MCSSSFSYNSLIHQEVVQAEQVLVVAVVTHDLVSQWVIDTSKAAHIHTHTMMPIARHPTVTTLDAHCVSINIWKIFVEA